MILPVAAVTGPGCAAQLLAVAVVWAITVTLASVTGCAGAAVVELTVWLARLATSDSEVGLTLVNVTLLLFSS